MPKLKTRKTLTKRIRITKNGKVVRQKVGLKHLMATKSVNQRRRSRDGGKVKSKQIKGRLKKMLGKHGKNI